MTLDEASEKLASARRTLAEAGRFL